MPSMSYLSPLHRAIASDDLQAVQRVMDEGVEPSSSDPWCNVLALAMQRACVSGNIEVSMWVNQCYPDLLKARNAAGEGLLHRWAAHDTANARSLRLWLGMGTDPEALDLDGNTPLLTAAASAQPEAIRALVRAGVDVNHQNHRGESALMVAVNAWQAQKLSVSTLFPNVLRLLLDSGVDPLLDDASGLSPAQRLGPMPPATALQREMLDAEAMRHEVFYQRALKALERSLDDPTVRRSRLPR